MPTKRGKRKPAPAIVPRFLKGAVTIGAIPAIAIACSKPQRMQPVVAYMAAPAQPDEAGPPPNPPPPPVVAAYQPPPPPPVVAAYQTPPQRPAPPIDAGVDAPVKAKTKTEKTKVKPPPLPVVAALIPRDKQ